MGENTSVPPQCSALHSSSVVLSQYFCPHLIKYCSRWSALMLEIIVIRYLGYFYTLLDKTITTNYRFGGCFFQRCARVLCGCDKTNRLFSLSIQLWWSMNKWSRFFYIYLQKTPSFFNEVPAVLNEDSMRHRMGPLQHSPASFFVSSSHSSLCFWTSRTPHLLED